VVAHCDLLSPGPERSPVKAAASLGAREVSRSLVEQRRWRPADGRRGPIGSAVGLVPWCEWEGETGDFFVEGIHLCGALVRKFSRENILGRREYHLVPMAPCMRLMGFIIPVIIFNSYRCVHFCTRFAASNLGAAPLAAGEAGQPAVQAHQHSDDEIPHPGKHGEEGESEKQCYCCGSFTFAHHLAG
jgi:hypothetical protein